MVSLLYFLQFFFFFHFFFFFFFFFFFLNSSTKGSGRDVVVVRGKVAQVEAALRTKLQLWEHESAKVQRIRTLQWSLPLEITEHVELVSGLSEFWLPPKKAKRVPAAPGNSVKAGYVIPDTVRRLYNMPKDNFRDVSKASSICLAEFQDDASFDKSDLAYFDQQTGERSSHVDHIVGPYQPGFPDAESLLDVEIASTLALNSTYWFWTVTGWMYEFSTDLFKQKDGPKVVSMSWGWGEQHQCDITTCSGITSRQYVDRVNTEFNKITATGVTLLAASGDQGAPGDTHGDDCAGLGTIFPGASPWVTSVGATMLDDKAKPAPPLPPPYKAPPVCAQFPCSNVLEEVACSIPEALITSGGGFSDYVLRPSWQNNAVLSYLNSSLKFPPQHMWHAANRGFPDVAAMGHAVLIADQGSMEQVDGTSASSPIFAAMVALWNGYRLNNKKSTLGFINPALYKAAETDKTAFKPIASGNNKCSESCCGSYGFEANPKGWDSVTGLGVARFPSLLNYFASLK
jgi:subtilase family serine protease